jgi:hypothetical protein
MWTSSNQRDHSKGVGAGEDGQRARDRIMRHAWERALMAGRPGNCMAAFELLPRDCPTEGGQSARRRRSVAASRGLRGHRCLEGLLGRRYWVPAQAQSKGVYTDLTSRQPMQTKVVTAPRSKKNSLTTQVSNFSDPAYHGRRA